MSLIPSVEDVDRSGALLLGHGPTYGLPLRRLGRGPTPPGAPVNLFGFWYERASVNRGSGFQPLSFAAHLLLIRHPVNLAFTPEAEGVQLLKLATPEQIFVNGLPDKSRPPERFSLRANSSSA